MRALTLLTLVAMAPPALAAPTRPSPTAEGERRAEPQRDPRLAVVGPKLLARWFVAVRPDASAAGARVVRVKSKGSFSGKVTVVARRVTAPSTVAAQTTGSLGGTSVITLTLPANGSGTPVHCITGEHHYQVSVWAGDAPPSEPLTLQVTPSSQLTACRGTRAVWFSPPGSYPGGVAPGPGASGAPPAYQKCLDHEAKVAAQPSVYRPGEDPWPDPDPGVAVNPEMDACR